MQFGRALCNIASMKDQMWRLFAEIKIHLCFIYFYIFTNIPLKLFQINQGIIINGKLKTYYIIHPRTDIINTKFSSNPWLNGLVESLVHYHTCTSYLVYIYIYKLNPSLPGQDKWRLWKCLPAWIKLWRAKSIINLLNIA